MAIRRVEQELEAKLQPPPGAAADAKGKLESKHYSDGVQRLKIKLSYLSVAGAVEAVILVGGREIARLPVERGAVRFDHSSPNPTQMPQFQAGERVEVEINGAVVLRGERLTESD